MFIRFASCACMTRILNNTLFQSIDFNLVDLCNNLFLNHAITFRIKAHPPQALVNLADLCLSVYIMSVFMPTGIILINWLSNIFGLWVHDDGTRRAH